MKNARLDEAEAGLKIAGKNINNLSYADAAATSAKSLQSCPTLCNPTDGNPLGSPIPGMLQEHWSGLQFPSPTHERHLKILTDPMPSYMYGVIEKYSLYFRKKAT